jgi:hypothetical protein
MATSEILGLFTTPEQYQLAQQQDAAIHYGYIAGYVVDRLECNTDRICIKY